MRLAFCLFKYFPYGGIPRDFRIISRAALARGHRVRVYVLRWEGERPPDMEVIVVPVRAVTNHTLYARYNRWVLRHIRSHPVDLVVGMNKMAGLDVYYAGDSCYEEKARTQRSWLYRLLPRYRFFSAAERAVFERSSSTQILMISQTQKPFFRIHYDTPDERFHALPPGINRSRVAPADTDEVRRRVRGELGLAEHEHLLLFVGSGFIKKGLDRVLVGLHRLPEPLRGRVQLVVAGQDNGEPFIRMARRLGVQDQVRFLGGRDDVAELMFAADAMVLPAYDENAGIVIVEALVAGLPILVTKNCGYATYVERTRGGIVHATPFDQQRFDSDLECLLTSPERDRWRANGRALANDHAIFELQDRAADYLERFHAERRPQVCFVAADARDALRSGAFGRSIEMGHAVRLICMRTSPDDPVGVIVERYAPLGLTRRTRLRRFYRYAAERAALLRLDCLIADDVVADADLNFAETTETCVERHLAACRPDGFDPSEVCPLSDTQGVE